jgi:hypothetical protein
VSILIRLARLIAALIVRDRLPGAIGIRNPGEPMPLIVTEVRGMPIGIGGRDLAPARVKRRLGVQTQSSRIDDLLRHAPITPVRDGKAP